jgi:catechol 2,3-dioxygenase-like lactoylglutathione lyase family enzyme
MATIWARSLFESTEQLDAEHVSKGCLRHWPREALPRDEANSINRDKHMSTTVERLVDDYEQRRIGRRQLIASLVALTAAATGARGQTTAPPVAQARTLNHVSIGVSDVERTAAFYQALLGLDVVSRPGNGGINLGLGDGFLGVYAIPGSVGRAHHFCLGVDDYDPDAIAARIRERGMEARVDRNASNRTSGGDQLYFSDPDGTTVQLSANGYQG